MPRYDIVFEDGAHRLAVPHTDLGTDRIAACLRLRPWHRLPFLCTVLRNFWAKKAGARLYGARSSA